MNWCRIWQANWKHSKSTELFFGIAWKSNFLNCSHLATYRKEVKSKYGLKQIFWDYSWFDLGKGWWLSTKNLPFNKFIFKSMVTWSMRIVFMMNFDGMQYAGIFYRKVFLHSRCNYNCMITNFWAKAALYSSLDRMIQFEEKRWNEKLFKPDR